MVGSKLLSWREMKKAKGYRGDLRSSLTRDFGSLRGRALLPKFQAKADAPPEPCRNLLMIERPKSNPIYFV
jgi:hypothetical protein